MRTRVRQIGFCLNGIVAAVLVWVALVAFAAPASLARADSVILTVNSTLDEPLALPPTGQCLSMPSGQCTLRAAIMLANRTGVNPVTIDVPSGIYTLTIFPAGNDGDFSGDLNISGTVPITLTGAGAATTIIDANQIDRVLSVVTGTVTIADLTFRHGLARGLGSPPVGAGIWNSATLTLKDSTVSENQAGTFFGPGAGGGLFNGGQLFLARNVITGNVADEGGGLYVAGSSIADSRQDAFVGNKGIYSGDIGGGVANLGSLSISMDDIAGNSAMQGGGLYNSGGAYLYASTVRGNTTVAAGGGIYNDSSGVLYLTNSTLSGNQSAGNGGGIYNYNTNSATFLSNATIAFNAADSDQNGSGTGGGIRNISGTVQFQNTLLAANTGAKFCALQSCIALPSDCAGALQSNGYNLIQSTGGCTINNDDATNVKGMQALLGPLADNGGPTLTHALLAGSPAIDAGNPLGCTDPSAPLPSRQLTTDQRGYPRPFPRGGRCDIGAFEYGFWTYLPLILR